MHLNTLINKSVKECVMSRPICNLGLLSKSCLEYLSCLLLPHLLTSSYNFKWFSRKSVAHLNILVNRTARWYYWFFWLSGLIKVSACCISVLRASKQQSLLPQLHSHPVHVRRLKTFREISIFQWSQCAPSRGTFWTLELFPRLVFNSFL